MLMNNDIKLHREGLFHLARHFDQGDVFAVSGKIYDFDETTFLYGNREAISRTGIFPSMKRMQTTPARPCLPAAVP